LLAEKNISLRSSKVCKYLQLKEIILKQIQTGHFKIGERLPSEVHLARQFQVSKMTARQAIQELENEGYVNRSQGKGTFVRRDSAEKKNSELIVLSPSMDVVSAQSSLFRALKGIMLEGYIRQANIKFVNIGDDGLIPETLKSDTLIAPLPGTDMLNQYRKMALAGYNILLINRIIDDFPGINYSSTDHYSEMYDACNYLLRKGHKKIGFASLFPDKVHIAARFQGYSDALQKDGIAVDPNQVVKLGDVLSAPEIKKIFQKRLTDVLTLTRPTALVVAEGYLLPHILETLYELNYKLPDDIEIMTFNKVPDDLKEKAFIHEIEEQYEEMGRLAVRQAIAADSGEPLKNYLVPAKLNFKDI
jgi:GntR family transcriptional regulator of arabinose operon